MPLSAIIVDDEALARRELRYLLERAGNVDVVAEASNGLEAVSTVLEHAPDIVFMDVQMPGLDGFAVLKRLMESNSLRMPEVIFATAFDQYAVRAFEVNAIDYLLKPFEEKRIALAVEKARQRRAGHTQAGGETGIETVPQASAEERLESLLKLLELKAQQTAAAPRARSGKVVVRSAQRLLLVDQREICFASIEDGTISVVTPSLQGISNVRTLEELQDQLDPELFWRAHRSFVVNIGHIREVVPWFKSSYLLRMDDAKHTEIPVARAQVKRLRELFNL